jgi:hypothetical protein
MRCLCSTVNPRRQSGHSDKEWCGYYISVRVLKPTDMLNLEQAIGYPS